MLVESAVQLMQLHEKCSHCILAAFHIISSLSSPPLSFLPSIYQQQAMVHRIFAPDRFSLRVIASVLTSGVPVPYRSVTPQELSQVTDADAHSELLATCIQRVKDCCVRWSKSRDFGAAASDGDSVHERELKCQARAFLRFIELCQRESDVTHCFTSACLQRPAYMHMADTNVFNTVTSIAVAASRQSLAFTYLTIPTAAVGEKPSTVSVSHSRAAGRAAIAAVSVALTLQNDLCSEMDVTLDRTFREHAVLDCRNLNWLGGSISEMAAAVQSSAPAVLLHLQSALPVDSNTAQQGSSHGWLLDYLGDVDEGKEGKGKGDRFTGSVCRYSEPTILDTSTTAAIIDTRKSSSESSEFLRAASRISRSKILGFYRLARLKAVVLSVLSSNSGSLHCSLSSHIDRELLPQVRTAQCSGHQLSSEVMHCNISLSLYLFSTDLKPTRFTYILYCKPTGCICPLYHVQS